MPVLSRFYGIIIRMYFQQSEHNPPHFHAIYGEDMAAICIKDGKILESVGFKQDGSKYPANIYTYDEHGNCIKKVSADNSMGNIWEYEYY